MRDISSGISNFVLLLGVLMSGSGTLVLITDGLAASPSSLIIGLELKLQLKAFECNRIFNLAAASSLRVWRMTSITLRLFSDVATVAAPRLSGGPASPAGPLAGLLQTEASQGRLAVVFTGLLGPQRPQTQEGGQGGQGRHLGLPWYEGKVSKNGSKLPLETFS